MQAIDDITRIEDIFAVVSAAELAKEIAVARGFDRGRTERLRDSVRKWPQLRRIPIEHWRGVRAALEKRGRALTLERLLDMHAPRKPRRSRPRCEPQHRRGGRERTSA